MRRIKWPFPGSISREQIRRRILSNLRNRSPEVTVGGVQAAPEVASTRPISSPQKE